MIYNQSREGLSNYSTDITKITPTIQTAGGTGATVSLGEGYYWFVESAKPTTDFLPLWQFHSVFLYR